MFASTLFSIESLSYKNGISPAKDGDNTQVDDGGWRCDRCGQGKCSGCLTIE